MKPYNEEFVDALKVLHIEDFADRIYNSNSRGELSHLQQYIFLATKADIKRELFREWFIDLVQTAEQHWERPESVFQHVIKIMAEESKQN